MKSAYEQTREEVILALRATEWNVSRAAERLAISRHALRPLMKKHGIETP